MAKVLYEEKTYREIPESMVIRQADDAWHPLKDRLYIEWWYFDLVNGDGGLVRGQLFIAGDVSRPGKVVTGVRASYVKTDGTEIAIEEKFPYSSFKASTEVCDVRIGRNFIRGDLSHYVVHIEGGEKALDLELDSTVGGFTSHACFGDETRYMYWVVPQPHCQARGSFRTKGETYAIEGVGYRDHNWLNIAPLDLLSYWDWGRVYNKEYTIIFADIVTSGRMEGAEVKPLLIYDSRRLVYLTTDSRKWSLTKSDMKPDADTGKEIPWKHALRVKDDGLSLEMTLDLQRAFQRIDLLADFNPLLRFLIRTFKAKPTITSFFSLGSGKMELDGQQKSLNCTAIHELVKNH